MLLKIRALLVVIILTLNCPITTMIKTDKMSLTNPNASDEAKNVYRFICDTFENHKIISGQQEGFSSADRNDENDYIFESTGKYPAIRGFDFVNDDFEGVYKRSVDWWENGGIVTICWHCSMNFNFGYDECKTDVIENWDSVLTKGTPENLEFVKNMDKAGAVLLKLQEKGIPVLWRPFHEFNGAWFWWGKGGPENFKALWIYMYDHFTNDLGLNNLIWVLGYSQNDVELSDFFDWYPGNKYCDIVGADSYLTSEKGAEKSLYDKCVRICRGKKPVILHECGLIPSPEEFKNAPWAAFDTWHSEYLTKENTKEHLKEIYTSEKVITLDELPDFRNTDNK